jgi:hypothetical protein
MSDAVATFARLQFELMDFALRLTGRPTEADVSDACEQVWNRVQGNRTGGAAITFDDFKLLFEATLDRCKDILNPEGEPESL